MRRHRDALPATSPDVRADRRLALAPWWLVGALGLGIFVAGFDQTFIVTILPNILDGLRLPVDRFGDASWIVSGYLIGYTVAMPVMGRLADVYGRVKIYLVSLAVFMSGSVLVAVAPGLPWFVVARALQAVGGGAVVPIGMAMAADALPQRRRPLGLGILTALDDASSLLGPLWGAALVGLLGWRGLFWLNVYLALPMVFLVPRLAVARHPENSVPMDWPGGLWLTAALVLLTTAMTDNGSAPRPLPLSIGLGIAGLVALAMFIRRELRTASPLVDVRLFARARYTAANLTFFIAGAGLITAMVAVPLMTTVLWEGTPLDGGLNLMRMLLVMPVGGILGGLLATRIGYRATAVLGLLCAGSGLLWMGAWPQTPGPLLLWGALLLAGLGFTLIDAPVIATVMDSVDEGRRAAAAAVLQVCQTLGMITGMALLATQGLGRFNHEAGRLFAGRGLEVTVEEYQAVLHRTFDETFLVAGITVLTAIVFGLLLEPGRARAVRLGRFFGL